MSEAERIWMDDQDGLIIVGDVLDGLEHLDDNSVEAIVTDPPYDLLQASRKGSGRSNNPDSPAGRHGTKTGGFMGMAWDATGVAFDPETWKACLRVLKPGGHMVVFGGTRTHHRMWCAIEDAGFEVREMLLWLYGQGFPKSLDVSKAIDKAAGAEREVVGQHPSPASTVRVETMGRPRHSGSGWQDAPDVTAPATDEAQEWEGWGTALKPAVEPILLARKPLSEPTVAANVLKWGTGALAIDATRIGTDTITQRQKDMKVCHGNQLAAGKQTHMTGVETQTVGRWPANVLLECTCVNDTEGGHQPDCPAGMLDEQSGERKSPQPYTRKSGSASKEVYGEYDSRDGQINASYGDSGGASRFFYCAKASRKERERGLDDLEIVLLEWESWEGEARKAKLLVDMAPSHPKVIDAFGLGDAFEWSTMLFGSSTMAPSLQDSGPTIETRTNSITESKTLSWLMRSLTNDSTADVNSAKASGGSRAESAAESSPKLSIIAGRTASLPGVGRVRSGTRLMLNGNAGSPATHPTAKPLALMRWLIRLVTPPEGIVLDPFCGSGSTLVAAAEEGHGFVGIDLSPEYCATAQRRVEGVKRG